MNKNKKKNLQKVKLTLSSIVIVSALSMGLNSSVFAQGLPIAVGTSGAAGATPELAVPEYTMSELQAASCDPKIWSTLVTNYLKKRGFERQIQGQIQVLDQAVAAPAASSGGGAGGTGSCWENALNSLSSGASALDGLLSMFSGGFNWNSIADKVMNQVSDYACNQLTNYTNKINYGIQSKINGVTGGLNDTLGGIGVRNQVVNIGVGDVITPKGSTASTTGPVTNGFNNAVGAFK